MRAPSLVIALPLLLAPAIAAATPPALAPFAPRAPDAPHHHGGVKYKRHSTALMAGGIALISVGAVSLGIGLGWWIGFAQNGGFGDSVGLVLGLPLTLNGAGCIAAGIPMTMIGKRQIPVGQASLAASLVPAIAPGPKTTLTWTF
jgi:hypothetical protein